MTLYALCIMQMFIYRNARSEGESKTTTGSSQPYTQRRRKVEDINCMLSNEEIPRIFTAAKNARHRAALQRIWQENLEDREYLLNVQRWLKFRQL
jgi:hypothetical protein